jgi:hypothetical protein
MKEHRTTTTGKTSTWRSTRSLEDILHLHLTGKTELSRHSMPSGGIPDAREFITAIQAFTPDVELTADGAVPYGLYTAFYWYAFNNYIYAYIPEVDSAERYEGKWATLSTVEEFVQEVQHSVWFDKWVEDMENHSEFPFK